MINVFRHDFESCFKYANFSCTISFPLEYEHKAYTFFMPVEIRYTLMRISCAANIILNVLYMMSNEAIDIFKMFRKI